MWKDVRAENLVRSCDQQGCPSCRLVVMITGHVPAQMSSGRRRLGRVSGTWLAGRSVAGRAMIVGLWA